MRLALIHAAIRSGIYPEFGPGDYNPKSAPGCAGALPVDTALAAVIDALSSDSFTVGAVFWDSDCIYRWSSVLGFRLDLQVQQCSGIQTGFTGGAVCRDSDPKSVNRIGQR